MPVPSFKHVEIIIYNLPPPFSYVYRMAQKMFKIGKIIVCMD
jgi:hypothetical protein